MQVIKQIVSHQLHVFRLEISSKIVYNDFNDYDNYNDNRDRDRDIESDLVN